jgi:2-polyprenyl-3-methyl-5-hydroxy-6-metoxy-1,4-benzoquinol methylase
MISKKIFKNKFLRLSECRTYFYLDPMPSEKELKNYYQTIYWNSRKKKSGVSLRDLQHFETLKDFAPNYLSKDLVFLNFGSGSGGGISHLMWLCGLNVINIDVIKVPNYYENRWKSFESILQVKDQSVDIVYGSHSLEHVTNIKEFKLQVRRILKGTGLVFWEVPNANDSNSGAILGKVHIPHTYYFTSDFFANWFTEIIMLGEFKEQEDVIKQLPITGNTGHVIRALGKI